MEQERKETLTIRIVSTTFVVVALAVFKPFGLDMSQWQAYAHLLAWWVLGIAVCILSEIIMTYVIKAPRSFNHGVSYIIRRNLWFQLINTPLIALMICLYRHFVLNNLSPGNQLSWSNYLETLAIIAFCSFAIGLYWRFKFRSRFLQVKLKETQLLNKQLKTAQQPQQKEGTITLTGTTNESVTLATADLLYIEAIGNYVKIHYLCNGQPHTDTLRATSKYMEDQLKPYPMIIRCHRAFLVNLQQVEQIISHAGTMHLMVKHTHDSLPVSRSNVSAIRNGQWAASHH